MPAGPVLLPLTTSAPFVGNSVTNYFQDPVSFQLIAKADGPVSTTVRIEVSNDYTEWDWVAEITTPADAVDEYQELFFLNLPYANIRANVLTLEGESASVKVNLGRQV